MIDKSMQAFDVLAFGIIVFVVVVLFVVFVFKNTMKTTNTCDKTKVCDVCGIATSNLRAGFTFDGLEGEPFVCESCIYQGLTNKKAKRRWINADSNNNEKSV